MLHFKDAGKENRNARPETPPKQPLSEVPIKRTFVHFESPKPNATMLSPKSVPPHFAPQGAAWPVAAQAHFSQLRSPKNVQAQLTTLRLSDFMSPVKSSMFNNMNGMGMCAPGPVPMFPCSELGPWQPGQWSGQQATPNGYPMQMGGNGQQMMMMGNDMSGGFNFGQMVDMGAGAQMVFGGGCSTTLQGNPVMMEQDSMPAMDQMPMPARENASTPPLAQQASTTTTTSTTTPTSAASSLKQQGWTKEVSRSRGSRPPTASASQPQAYRSSRRPRGGNR